MVEETATEMHHNSALQIYMSFLIILREVLVIFPSFVVIPTQLKTRFLKEYILLLTHYQEKTTIKFLHIFLQSFLYAYIFQLVSECIYNLYLAFFTLSLTIFPCHPF